MILGIYKLLEHTVGVTHMYAVFTNVLDTVSVVTAHNATAHTRNAGH
jgi:hypothetical protein